MIGAIFIYKNILMKNQRIPTLFYSSVDKWIYDYALHFVDTILFYDNGCDDDTQFLFLFAFMKQMITLQNHLRFD